MSVGNASNIVTAAQFGMESTRKSRTINKMCEEVSDGYKPSDNKKKNKNKTPRFLFVIAQVENWWGGIII